MRVAFLGPKGTHAEMAARSYFGEEIEAVPCPTISEVAMAVERGETTAGVVPVESSREGSVGEALDVIAWRDVRVRAEIVVPISHCLLGIQGAKLHRITQVLSHPQALAQCRAFLRETIPNAELVEMSSTAKAAEQLSKLQQPHTAVIGPRTLAEIYSLEVMRQDIQGEEENLTRFLCLAREDCAKPTGSDKTSIVFYTAEDRPGVLHEILGEFASRRINLTKIESRPSKRALGEYLFFLDFEGHRADAVVRDALEGVERKTAWLKVAGSYPRFRSP